MADKTERYKIIIDIDQAKKGYEILDRKVKAHKESLDEVAKAAIEVAKAEDALAKAGDDKGKKKEAKKVLAAATKELTNAMRAEKAALQAVDREVKKGHVLSGITLKAQARERAERDRNGRAILRQLRSNVRLRAELRKVVDSSGSVKFAFDRQGKALDETSRRLERLAAKYPQLREEIKRISAIGGVGAAGIVTPADVSGFGGLSPFQLRQLAGAFDSLGIAGTRTLGMLATGLAGIPIGIAAATVGVVGLTALFIKLTQVAVQFGVKAAKAFAGLIKDSVAVADQFDSVAKSFTAVLGSASAAEVVIDKIQDKSIETGIELEQIVRKVLPLVSSVDQALSLGELAVGLGQLDPRVGVQGAVRAIQAGVVGRLQPLQRTFDIDTAPIARLQDELGDLEGFIIGLGQVMVDRGLDIETMSDTFTLNIAAMQARWRDFQRVLGDPVVDQFLIEMEKLKGPLDERREDFDKIANAIGLIVADAVEILSDKLVDMLEAFDEKDVERISNALFTMGESVHIILESLTGFEGREGIDFIVEGLEWIADRAQTASRNTFVLFSQFKALKEVLDIVGTEFEPVDVLFPSARAIRAIANLKDAGDATQAYNDSLVESRKEYLEYLEDFDKVVDAQDEFIENQKELTIVAEAEADALLANQLAARNLAEAEAELAEATEEVNKKKGEALQKLEFANRDAILKRDRALLDLEEASSKKRADAERKHTQKMMDIRDKHNDRVADAGLDADRAREDAELDHADKLADIAIKSGEKRIKIEEDFQDKLDEIRRKFNFQAEEAIRDNDAVALQRIRRRMQFELEEAKLARQEKIDAQNDDDERDRAQALLNAERKNRDLKTAADRKLADLQKQLIREEEAERLSIERRRNELELEQFRRAEEIQKNLDREMQDLITQYNRRFEELERSLDRETAARQEAADAAVRIAIEETRRINAARSREGRLRARFGGDLTSLLPGAGGTPLDADGNRIPNTRGTRASRGSSSLLSQGPDESNQQFLYRLQQLGIPLRALGGPAPAGEPVVMGDPDPARPNRPNPEVFIPSVNGMVVPLNRMMFSPGGVGGGSSTIFNQQRTAHADISMVDLDRLSPAAEQRVRNIIVEVLKEAVGG